MTKSPLRRTTTAEASESDATRLELKVEDKLDPGESERC